MSLKDDAEGLHRFGDILHLLLAHRLEAESQLLLNLPDDLSRNTDSARVCQLLKPGRDIDALAIPVLALNDHLAEIDPDPDPDPLVLGNGGIPFGQPARQRDGAFHGVHHAAKFGEHPVAHKLENLAVMASNLRLKQFLASRTKALECASLVALHQRGIAHDISSEDGGKLAVHWFGLTPQDYRTGRT
ncbi:hypothetical protein J2W42_006581 [Rhizobium tibeticum]|nr:hypothetical protein [Rhizobium tibeticum]